MLKLLISPLFSRKTLVSISHYICLRIMCVYNIIDNCDIEIRPLTKRVSTPPAKRVRVYTYNLLDTPNIIYTLLDRSQM